jgi:hypothetical protein
MQTITRRALVGSAAALVTAPVVSFAAPAQMVVNKDPNCGCCTGWVEHVRAAGFDVRVIEMADLAPLKSKLGIPRSLSSCHTAQIDGYVIEGHVPAAVIKRLLSERPTAIGLAVPGMPVGSPGMEVPGTPDDHYNVVLFGPSGQQVYARFKGAQELG